MDGSHSQNGQQKPSGTFDALSLLQRVSRNQESMQQGSGDSSVSISSNRATTVNESLPSNHSLTTLGRSAYPPPVGAYQQQQQPQQQQLQQQQGSSASAQNQLLSLALSSGILGSLAAPNASASAPSPGASLNQQLQAMLLQQLASLHNFQTPTAQTGAPGPSPKSPAFTGTVGGNDTAYADVGQQQQQQQQPPPQSESIARSTKAPEAHSDPSQISDLPQSPASIVVPCRARGLSMEHNFQTAYFVIPEDIKHGEGLICSYPACQQRGIRFLYCAYCKDAVARRNFRNKHNHAGDDTDARSKSEGAPSKVDGADISSQAKEPAPAERQTVTSSSSNQLSSGNTSSEMSSKSSNESRTERKRSAKSSSWISASNLKSEEERCEAWAKLLDNRPKTDNGDEMSAWLMQVMAVSNVKKPLQEVTALIRTSDFSSSSSQLDSSDTVSSDDNNNNTATATTTTNTNSSSGGSSSGGSTTTAKNNKSAIYRSGDMKELPRKKARTEELQGVD